MPRIEMLVKCISIYSRRVPKSDWNIQVVSAICVLDEYLRFNKKRNHSIPFLEKFLEKHSALLDRNTSKGGTKKIDLDTIAIKEPPSFDSVVSFRSSIRHFGAEKLEMSCVDNAITLAKNSPSTCNRQSTRILRTSDRETIEKILFIQKGAKGFSEGITCLLIVCTDLACYQGDGDRHSGIIDASLFGMTLIHSLTRFQIASIPLNWSKTYSEDLKLRRLINIPNSYNVLFLIGLGSFKKGIQVPVSTKNDIVDICEDIFLKEN
jgi:nitroreductase